MTAFTVDSSFMVKGLVPVRRSREDELRAKQEREFRVSSEYLAGIERGEHQMYVPAIALVEVAAVISRLTNSRSDAKAGAEFVRRNALRLFYEADLLDQAIDTAISIKTGGYDTIFLTVAKMTGSTLLTADRIRHEMAKKLKVDSMLLYELLIE